MFIQLVFIARPRKPRFSLRGGGGGGAGGGWGGEEARFFGGGEEAVFWGLRGGERPLLSH